MVLFLGLGSTSSSHQTFTHIPNLTCPFLSVDFDEADFDDAAFDEEFTKPEVKKKEVEKVVKPPVSSIHSKEN